MTWCQTSLSLAFLHAVWTPKFWGWMSSSIVPSQVVLGRPMGLLQSDGGRRAAEMTRWWSSSWADRAKCPKNCSTLFPLELPSLQHVCSQSVWQPTVKHLISVPGVYFGPGIYYIFTVSRKTTGVIADRKFASCMQCIALMSCMATTQ